MQMSLIVVVVCAFVCLRTETLMDTKWATTELAWTAHPETGVSITECVCVCECVRACVSVCVPVCVCTCLYMCLHLYGWGCVHMRLYTCVCVCEIGRASCRERV